MHNEHELADLKKKIRQLKIANGILLAYVILSIAIMAFNHFT